MLAPPGEVKKPNSTFPGYHTPQDALDATVTPQHLSPITLLGRITRLAHVGAPWGSQKTELDVPRVSHAARCARCNGHAHSTFFGCRLCTSEPLKPSPAANLG